MLGWMLEWIVEWEFMVIIMVCRRTGRRNATCQSSHVKSISCVV